jgi:hypothetical protein
MWQIFGTHVNIKFTVGQTDRWVSMIFFLDKNTWRMFLDILKMVSLNLPIQYMETGVLWLVSMSVEFSYSAPNIFYTAFVLSIQCFWTSGTENCCNHMKPMHDELLRMNETCFAWQTPSIPYIYAKNNITIAQLRNSWLHAVVQHMQACSLCTYTRNHLLK